MSALGQKRTFWPFTAMSALPPIADIRISSDYDRRSKSGSFATLAAIRRASSLLSNLAAESGPHLKGDTKA
jgi:hypothetical protein